MLRHAVGLTVGAMLLAGCGASTLLATDASGVEGGSDASPCPSQLAEGERCTLPAGTACTGVRACVSCGPGLWTWSPDTRCTCRSGTWVCDVDADCFSPGPGNYRDRLCTVPSLLDAGTDTGLRPECDRAEDCLVISSLPGSVAFCAGLRNWSCLDHRCSWECGASRTCATDAEGCVACLGAEPTCPTTRCQLPITREVRVEDATCMRAFHTEVATCFGDWVRLHDGTLCSNLELPTGALRSVLVCGRCQTQLGY